MVNALGIFGLIASGSCELALIPLVQVCLQELCLYLELQDSHSLNAGN